MIERLRLWLSSYRARLALGSIGAVTLLAGVWAWSLYGPLTSAIIDQQRVHLRTIAQTSAYALGDSRAQLSSRVRALVTDTSVRMTVVDSNGSVLADSENDPDRMASHADRPEIREALAGRIGYATRVSPTQGTLQLYVAVPARLGGLPVAVRVSETQAHVDAMAASVRNVGLLALAIALAAAMGITWRLSASAAEPVRRLVTTARSMADGDLRVPVSREPGELGAMSAALTTLRDHMRARMAELQAGQDALRTALDGLPDAVLLLDGDVITFANGPASRLFGAPPSGWERKT